MSVIDSTVTTLLVCTCASLTGLKLLITLDSIATLLLRFRFPLHNMQPPTVIEQ